MSLYASFETEMELSLLAVGLLLVAFGGLNLTKPDNPVVRNFVSPKDWQRNPAAAAEKQRRKVKHAGYVLVISGTLFLVGGILA